MKQFFLPFLTLLGISYLKTPSAMAQKVDVGEVMNIALKGDANTEQSAKLELIRILQERLNKLTVAQLNSRIIVSKGVVGYYKVDEILKMSKEIYGYRSKYVTMAQKIEAGNPGFSAHQGNGFAYKYIFQLNSILDKADIIKTQLLVIVKSGKPIELPAMPTFSITPAASMNDIAGNFQQTMEGIFNQYNIKEEGDVDRLSPEQRVAFQAAVDAAKGEFEKGFSATVSESNKKSLVMFGNVVGTLVGVPGAGTLIAGVASGNGAAAISGLVGSILDKFAIPDDYYDSNTLKLTDAERLKVVDELHVRMSDLYQQVAALGASLSNETKTRYNELAQPRNEQILYGPKK